VVWEGFLTFVTPTVWAIQRTKPCRYWVALQTTEESPKARSTASAVGTLAVRQAPSVCTMVFLHVLHASARPEWRRHLGCVAREKVLLLLITRRKDRIHGCSNHALQARSLGAPSREDVLAK